MRGEQQRFDIRWILPQHYAQLNLDSRRLTPLRGEGRTTARRYLKNRVDIKNTETSINTKFVFVYKRNQIEFGNELRNTIELRF